MPSLPERLLERIAREGPISFYDFMRAALYDPADGYYSRGAAIGEGGDFLTSPHASPAFAAALARLFAIEADGTAARVDLVDVGAGDGRFLED
ncbi:MAG TPA: class I SAM-dependent methyltransferase, partial [Thermoanaerobaculia bacterium]|nr:class I SAM-dependent methyltransferase [Thermoanaerobaculia bacterium]